MTIILVIAFGMWYSAETSNKRAEILASRGAFIDIDEEEYRCERLEYRGANALGDHLLTCVGASKWNP